MAKRKSAERDDGSKALVLVLQPSDAKDAAMAQRILLETKEFHDQLKHKLGFEGDSMQVLADNQKEAEKIHRAASKGIDW